RGDRVVQRLSKNRNGILLGLAFDDLEGAIDDALGHRLLAGAHDRVHGLRHHQIPVVRVRMYLSLLGTVTARHGVGPRSSLCSSLFMTAVGLLPATQRKTTQSLGSFCSVLGASLL